ncbi:hypothetical protein NE237_026079 [Protea cynaroides]|uniref:Uncharacterized protein n=1 Tax=Protea cynaroides TaxID=273540 RepID=A0A9Q0K2D7_9MAGN|nr:hypothetical protein NE237_026079 [Protea cynaroides]
MLDEFEAMLEMVDPQPTGKLGSMKWTKFNLPKGCIQKEIAADVTNVVQMLNEEDDRAGASTRQALLVSAAAVFEEEFKFTFKPEIRCNWAAVSTRHPAYCESLGHTIFLQLAQ